MWGMGWGVGMIAMVAFWVFIIAAIVWAFRAADRRAFPGGHRETPLEILQRRYASGDIGRDEYEQKRRDLGGSTISGRPPKE
jgi:putative membrane protein